MLGGKGEKGCICNTLNKKDFLKICVKSQKKFPQTTAILELSLSECYSKLLRDQKESLEQRRQWGVGASGAVTVWSTSEERRGQSSTNCQFPIKRMPLSALAPQTSLCQCQASEVSLLSPPLMEQTHNKLYNYSIKICHKAWKTDSLTFSCESDQLSIQKAEAGTPNSPVLAVRITRDPSSAAAQLGFTRDL